MNSIIRHAIAPNARRCAFTGYRPAKMPFGYDELDPRCIDFKKRLTNTILMLIDQGYSHFLSGGAMATDTFAAEAVLALKDRYPHITLEMVSPFDGQADKWSAEYKARHDKLFNLADVVTAIAHEYTQSCMFRRNQYLVTNADILVAAYDGQDGGTKMTVELAHREGVQVLLVPPITDKKEYLRIPVSGIPVMA